MLHLRIYDNVHEGDCPLSHISLWSYVSTMEWDAGPIYSVNTGIPCRGLNGMPSFFKLPVVSQRYCSCIFQITEKADFNMGLFFRNGGYTIWLTGMPKLDVYPIVKEYFKIVSCPWWTNFIHMMNRDWSHFLLVKSPTSWIQGLRVFYTYMINLSKFCSSCWVMTA